MKNFLIGLLIGVLACGLTCWFWSSPIARFAGSFANRPVSVADGSTLVLDLEGDVPERLPAEIPIPILQNQTPLSVAAGVGHVPQGRRRFTHSWNSLRAARPGYRLGQDGGDPRRDFAVQEIRQADHYVSAQPQRRANTIWRPPPTRSSFRRKIRSISRDCAPSPCTSRTPSTRSASKPT